jgi:hypothetical protein
MENMSVFVDRFTKVEEASRELFKLLDDMVAQRARGN